MARPGGPLADTTKRRVRSLPMLDLYLLTYGVYVVDKETFERFP